MTRGRGRTALIWLGIAVTAVFTYLAVRNVEPDEVWAALRDAQIWWLVPAVVALAASIVIRAVRWQYLFPRATRPPLQPVLRALLIGYFFNNVLPARAGEAARIVALTQQARVSRVQTAGTVVLERVYDVVSLLALLFVLVPLLPEVTWLRPAIWLAVALAIALAVGALVLARWGERPFRTLLGPLERLPFLAGRLESAPGNLATGLAGLRDVRLALLALSLTTISWLVMGVSFWLVMLAFDLGLSAAAGLFVLIATGLAAILPSSPAGVGVFEAAAILALSAYDVDRSQALSYALVLHAVNFVPFIVAGLLVLHVHASAVARARRT